MEILIENYNYSKLDIKKLASKYVFHYFKTSSNMKKCVDSSITY